MSAYSGVLEALIQRGHSGRGVGLKVSLFDAIADWMNVPLLQFEACGRAPKRVGLAHPGICPYGAFKTADGMQVLIAIQNEREWASFCERFLQEPQLSSRSGFESNVARVSNRSAVDARIAETFAQLTREETVIRLRQANTAFGFVNDIAALARHSALRRMSIETPAGPARLVAPAVIASDGPYRLGPVPAIGEHSPLIRAEFLPSGGA
jgi:crotonobetainyl-CoA:carnitine CoA-transferase CaiB-like acyl-CoA transferase